MQDIRPELKERLKQIQDQREVKRTELAALDAVERSLLAVLESENALWSRLAATSTLFDEDEEIQESGKSLPGLLHDLLRDGRTWAMGDLKNELNKRGYPFGDRSPGRAINFALVGMAKNGVVENLGEGSWRLIRSN